MTSPGTTELHVEGMTCNNCARKVTEAAQDVPGVHSVSVNVQTAHASVRWNPDAAKNVDALLNTISRAGYAATELSAGHQSPQKRWEWNLIVGLSITGALMAGEWILGLAMVSWFQWLAFVLAGVVQIFCGAQFYRGAWRQLKVGQSNMDTLVALGSTTAFGYSMWALLTGAGGHVYFMEAAAVISLISFGHWLESRASDKAGVVLKSLLNLAPQTARRLSPPPEGQNQRDGKTNLRTLSFSQSAIGNRQSAIETEVPISQLQTGDHVALRPGDRVPVDGVVLEGESAVDESMLTGESLPTNKKNGNELFAGTVNLNGRLVMRVTATGEATALAHIVATVQRAQTSRANIQRLGDRVSSVFVPVIVVIALAAGLWWALAPISAVRLHGLLAPYFWHVHPPVGVAAGFIIAAAVLIIACPCAMGLATPAAIMAAANAAARRGILIRDGVALEKAGEITAVIFDKTGTLTTGELAFAGPWTPTDSEDARREAQRLAGALAKPSNHPVSRVLAPLADNQITLDSWREIPGMGVQASAKDAHGNTNLFRLGSMNWLKDSGIALPESVPLIEKWLSDGASLAGLSRDNSIIGIFAVIDLPRNNASKVVWQLQRSGLKCHLLTGDNSRTAAAIAKQVGIPAENVFAEVRPGQKAEFVKKLQAQGERVAFVGDGINDAPALTQADLGIAVSRASDIAREAADIILLKSEIEAVPEALGLARATLRIIRQNLFWAFFYNALGVPLAALGFVSPISCAVAMACSDFIVIGNALRLLRYRLKS